MSGLKFKDYYAIMGLSPDASQDEIKTAYRKLARTHHPDVSKEKDALKRFTDLGEAYEAIGDPEKRKAYDEVRLGGWRDGQEFTSPRAHHPDHRRSVDPNDEQFSDFFSSLFGAQRRNRAQAYEGEDLHHAINITLEEAFTGSERDLQIQMPSGISTEAPSVRTLHIKIPRGLQNGENIRLRGQGQPGSVPELNGNLYLEINLTPHAFYRVDGRDIQLELPLTPWEAVLGAQITVPTLGGNTVVSIPSNATEGQKLRLRGRGLPGKPAGDQYLTLRITVPPNSNDKAQALWRELATISPYNPRVSLAV